MKAMRSPMDGLVDLVGAGSRRTSRRTWGGRRCSRGGRIPRSGRRGTWCGCRPWRRRCRGDDEVAVDDVVGQVEQPRERRCWRRLAARCREVGGEVVAVGGVGVLGVAVVAGHLGVGLVLGDAVEVDDAVLEVDAVAGDADAALDEVEVGGFGVGLEEDDDVAAADVAVVDEGRPVRRAARARCGRPGRGRR